MYIYMYNYIYTCISSFSNTFQVSGWWNMCQGQKILTSWIAWSKTWCTREKMWMRCSKCCLDGNSFQPLYFFFAGNLVDFYQKGCDMILHLRVVIVPYIACRFRDLELFMALVSVTLAVVGTIFLYWANEIKGLQRYRKCDEASGSALAVR